MHLAGRVFHAVGLGVLSLQDSHTMVRGHQLSRLNLLEHTPVPSFPARRCLQKFTLALSSLARTSTWKGIKALQSFGALTQGDMSSGGWCLCRVPFVSREFF